MSDVRVQRYTILGGYPIMYVEGGDTFCPDCVDDMSEEDKARTEAHVHWEGELFCDECSKKLESAYGDVE